MKSQLELVAENDRLRRLLADVHTALLASGWHDDELIRRVKVETVAMDSSPNGEGETRRPSASHSP